MDQIMKYLIPSDAKTSSHQKTSSELSPTGGKPFKHKRRYLHLESLVSICIKFIDIYFVLVNLFILFLIL